MEQDPIENRWFCLFVSVCLFLAGVLYVVLVTIL
jgi:hypothetical protein